MNTTKASCVFCGSIDQITRDHVPPKNIFPTHKRQNLITVPSCHICNNATAKDDEYFRLKICLSENVGRSEDAAANREPVFRSLNRPEFVGLRKQTLADLRQVQLKTPAGLYVGQATASHVDLNRIFRVIDKTVRGLFFHELGHRFPSTHDVQIHSDDTLQNQSREVLEHCHETILLPLMANAPKTVAEGVFRYRFGCTAEDLFTSAWALTFFDRMSFLAITGPIGVASTINS